MTINIPRGTVDILPGEVELWSWMEQVAREVTQRNRYREIRTPIFEHTELFVRGVGDTTDIVEKEMYTFADRKDRSLTLRPEGTAGVIRSLVENKLYSQSPLVKLSYMGPMFRYERPQAGRQRQFHQFGIEAVGSTDPAIDAEVIALGMSFFDELGLQGIRAEINNVGNKEERQTYFQRLIEYFLPFEAELAADARSRLHRNPMRILDSKDPRTKEIAAGAPSILDFLSSESLADYETIQRYLTDMGVNYVLNDRIVRGLDYYTQVAFEYMIDLPGAQASTLGGGGRYNGLVQELGGPELPGVGFGIGLERIILALQDQKLQPPYPTGIDCYLIAMGEKAKEKVVPLLNQLRKMGLLAEMDYLDRKMKAQFKAADRENAKYVAILGDDELARQEIQVKNLATGEQESIAIEQLGSYLTTKK
ncbi:histidine--tRNA ligase [Risungbinella massiliensis]|uniref:histidine--tRNA ligase n=1 Tax=Risungbinella massiliensis TaxID=1329796 RepID=UPI0005CC5A0C|nr:histidine--tRNA ligase [Risungbinella massiliensis]